MLGPVTSIYFYPRPPRGGRLPGTADPAQLPQFLSTPSARRATVTGQLAQLAQNDFYPRPPRGGRPSHVSPLLVTYIISIHALREEGDGLLLGLCGADGDFYPRPPRGGRRRKSRPQGRWKPYFYPRPPRGGRPSRRLGKLRALNFYPRPPRGGRLHEHGYHDREVAISIHALREEGDKVLLWFVAALMEFLSTPSARRATCRRLSSLVRSSNFYPRPPRGGRLLLNSGRPGIWAISIHALREEGDRQRCAGRLPCTGISIHALREEGDMGWGAEGSGPEAISIHALREEGDGPKT